MGTGARKAGRDMEEKKSLRVPACSSRTRSRSATRCETLSDVRNDCALSDVQLRPCGHEASSGLRRKELLPGPEIQRSAKNTLLPPSLAPCVKLSEAKAAQLGARRRAAPSRAEPLPAEALLERFYSAEPKRPSPETERLRRLLRRCAKRLLKSHANRLKRLTVPSQCMSTFALKLRSP